MRFLTSLTVTALAVAGLQVNLAIPATASTCAVSVATLSEMRSALSGGVSCDELVVTVTADIAVTGGQLEFVSEADLVIQSDGTTRTFNGDGVNRILFTGAPLSGQNTVRNDSQTPVPQLTLIDLAFTNGSPSAQDLASWGGSNGGSRGGGAIYANRAVLLRDVTITNSTVSASVAAGGGGALFENGPVVIEGATVSGNAGGNSGGGLRIDYTRVGANDLCISFDRLVVSDNTSTAGTGGVRIQCDIGEGLVTITNSEFRSNATTQDVGGALTIGRAKSTSISATTFTGNSAGQWGGGAVSVSDGSLWVQDSTFENNAATAATGDGGAIRSYRPSVTIVNSTFVGNTAGNSGDAIFSGTNNGTTTLRHVTVHGSGTASAVVMGAGTSTLISEGSIIVDLVSGCSGIGYFSATNSVIAASGCDTPNESTNNWINDGSTNVWDNAWLASLSDNGGTTKTMLPSSAQADVFLRVPAANESCIYLNEDQRGEPRPGVRTGTSCWAGAAESVVVRDPLTVTVSSHSLTPGAPVPTITYTPSVSGVNITGITCSTTYTPSSPTGTYPTTCTGGQARWFTITPVNGTITVALPTPEEPVTTPVPSAPTTTAPPAPPASIAPISPNAGLQAGSSLVTLDGVEVPVVLTREANTVTLTGDGFGMSLIGLDQNQTAGSLDADGNLILEAGGYARVAGNGFAPNTDVMVYLFSDPVGLGTVPTDETGSFDALLPVPADTPAGPHTVQANGFTRDGQVRSMNLGVVVPATELRLPATGSGRHGAVLALLFATLGTAGLLAGRRRTTA
jgi:hypothetical protein